jgi:hypothetical protein
LVTALRALSDLMTVDEAAELLRGRIRRDELMQATRDFSLKHIPMGRRRLTTEAWIIEWLGAQMEGRARKTGRD